MKIFRIVLTTFLFLMLGLILVNMVARHFDLPGVSWGDVAIRYLLLWLGFIGALVTTLQGRHIAIDILPRFVPAKIKPWVVLFEDVMTIFICGFLAFASWKFVQQEKMFPEELFWGVNSWHAAFVVPGVFVGIVAVEIFRLVKARYRNGGPL